MDRACRARLNVRAFRYEPHGAARQLPGSLGATLLDTVRGAFLQQLELAAVSSVVEVGTGVTAMILLRRVRAGFDSEDG